MHNLKDLILSFFVLNNLCVRPIGSEILPKTQIYSPFSVSIVSSPQILEELSGYHRG